MTDIISLPCFHFWEPVYFLLDKEDLHFPSLIKEKQGHFVGITEHIGDQLTFFVYTDNTKQVIAYSALRSALDP